MSFTAGGPSLPGDYQAAKLASWTTFPVPGVQAFAGTARYKTTFAAPPSGGKAFELDLGDVRQSARVRLNGKDLGTLIAPPFRVVVDHLQRTGNVLEVEVTSVAANRIRGPGPPRRQLEDFQGYQHRGRQLSSLQCRGLAAHRMRPAGAGDPDTGGVKMTEARPGGECRDPLFATAPGGS